jgi:hypothetical protein
MNLSRGLTGQPADFEGPVRVDLGGVVTNAMLSVKNGRLIFQVERHRNNPKIVDQQIANLEQRKLTVEEPVTIKVTARVKFGFDRSRVGDLRSAFIAAFAMFGYRYAYSSRLDGVRQQILRPDEALIDGAFWIAGPELTEDPMLMVMLEPVPAVLVRMRTSLVALPWMTGPDDFYSAIRANFAVPNSARQMFDVLEWPTTLYLLFDFTGQSEVN